MRLSVPGGESAGSPFMSDVETRRKRLPRGGGPLWAVTSYFNPVGYERRLRHYHEFRRNLAVPLVAVELSFDNRFDLGQDAADILLRLKSPDVLWQKERLLNVAFRELPPECEAVAWLDCDIVFDDDLWGERTIRALDRFSLVQPFERVHFLPPDGRPDGRPLPEGTNTRESLPARMLAGAVGDEIFEVTGTSLTRGYTPGHGWAARRELIDDHGLYDALILGCGDKAICSAAYGKIEEVIRAIPMNEAQAVHFREWAVPFSRAVAGNIGFVEGEAYHLWHGRMKNRRYVERYVDLAPYRFDPARDIFLDRSGVWRWNEGTEEMHRFVRQYFKNRREDG